MRRVRITDAAERDLDQIWTYVASESGSITIADRVLDVIFKRFTTLVQQPKAGTIRSEFGADVRSLQAGNYMIYYRGDGALIRIIRVIHGMRDQTKAWTEP